MAAFVQFVSYHGCLFDIYDFIFVLFFLEEKKCSIYGTGARWDDGEVVDAVSIDENTALRLVRKEAIR